MNLPAPTRRRRVVGLTPLIDVVFLLLIFFMLATTFLEKRSIELTAPQEMGKAAGMRGAILVRISADGEVDVAGKRMSLDALQQYLATRRESRPDLRVAVQPGRSVSLQRIVAVFDRAKAAGIDNVALVR